MRRIQNILEISVRRKCDMIWTVFEIIVSLFESCVVIHFICVFLKNDFKTKRGKLVFILGVALDFISVTIINHISVYEGITGAVYILIYAIYSVLFFYDSFLRKIFVSIITVVVMLSVSVGMTGLISTVFSSSLTAVYEPKTVERGCTVISVQILLICIYDLILKYSVVSLKKTEWKLILSILSISFITTALIHVVIINADIEKYYVRLLVVSELGIIILNIVCFYMTYTLSKSNSETEKFRMQKQQEEYRAQYAENIKSQYDEICRTRHDMKQNLAVILTLHKEEKYKEAGEYAEKISDKLAKLEIFIDVGNDFINAILNSKLSMAKERKIKVMCVSSSDIKGVEVTDLCNLLGNMLDNAIEAAEQCSNGFIDVSINSDENKIHVIIANSIKGPVLKNNCNLISTKKDNNIHGYGVKTIRSIAEKYGGTANFYENESVFYCQVIMYKQILKECVRA